MFTKAIVRKPGRSMVDGISSMNQGKPDYSKALTQHQIYVKALEACGLQVTTLDPEEEYPDSTFVEDAALLTRKCAIITRPGALSRRGEIETIRTAVSGFYSNMKKCTETRKAHNK